MTVVNDRSQFYQLTSTNLQPFIGSKCNQIKSNWKDRQSYYAILFLACKQDKIQ